MFTHTNVTKFNAQLLTFVVVPKRHSYCIAANFN